MKLLYCPKCEDVRKLRWESVTCSCGKSWGHYYKDGLHAVVGGKAIPLGFANPSLATALKKRPANGQGSRFEAFVIPRQCPTVEELP